MRPLFAITGFRKIAESIPLERFCGNRAAQFDLAVTDSDNFPIPFTRSAIDKNFLTDIQVVSLCKRNVELISNPAPER
jgi:hypothetical protein